MKKPFKASGITKKNQTTEPPQSFSKQNKIWLRSKECGHEWDERTSQFLKRKGCTCCDGRKVFSGFNNLYTTHPEVTARWHSETQGKTSSIIKQNSRQQKSWVQLIQIWEDD